MKKIFILILLFLASLSYAQQPIKTHKASVDTITNAYTTKTVVLDTFKFEGVNLLTNLRDIPVPFAAVAGWTTPNLGTTYSPWQIFRGTEASPVECNDSLGTQNIFVEIVSDASKSKADPATAPAAIRAVAIQKVSSMNTFAGDFIALSKSGSRTTGAGAIAIHALSSIGADTIGGFAGWFQATDGGYDSHSVGIEINNSSTHATRTAGQTRGMNIVNVPSNTATDNDWGLCVQNYGKGLALSNYGTPAATSAVSLIYIRNPGDSASNAKTSILSFESPLALSYSYGLDFTNSKFTNGVFKYPNAAITNASATRNQMNNTGAFWHFGYNSQVIPLSDGTQGGLTIGWNKSGAAVDFWNCWNNATYSFYFRQKTGDSTSVDLGRLVTSSAHTAFELISGGTAKQAFVNYYDSVTVKFQTGKQTDNSYIIRDAVNGASALTVASTGTVTVASTASSQNVNISPASGGSTAINSALTVGGLLTENGAGRKLTLHAVAAGDSVVGHVIWRASDSLLVCWTGTQWKTIATLNNR